MLRSQVRGVVFQSVTQNKIRDGAATGLVRREMCRGRRVVGGIKYRGIGSDPGRAEMFNEEFRSGYRRDGQ